MQQVPAYYTTDDVRWKCPDEFKFKVVEAAKEEYGKLGYDLILVDGVRAEREDGWALIRASNTAPQLVMSWEGKTKKAHDEIGAELQDIVARVMYAMGLEPGVLA
ncbi:MAG: hypothetical protein H5T86_11190 [Armatimonadetes bacterium]|nr:hypothetical protein [Armatimonadota bacterium]